MLLKVTKSVEGHEEERSTDIYPEIGYRLWKDIFWRICHLENWLGENDAKYGQE